MSQADAFSGEAGYHFPLAALAEIFAVSEVQVRNYVKQGMPQAARGRYDVRECVQWLIDQKCRSARSVTEVSSAAELNVARRRKIELELATAAGALVKVEEAAQVFTAIATAVAGALDALGPRVAPMVARETNIGAIERVVTAEARLVRGVIADELARFGATLGSTGRLVVDAVSAEPVPAPPKRRRKRATTAEARA